MAPVPSSTTCHRPDRPSGPEPCPVARGEGAWGAPWRPAAPVGVSTLRDGQDSVRPVPRRSQASHTPSTFHVSCPHSRQGMGWSREAPAGEYRRSPAECRRSLGGGAWVYSSSGVLAGSKVISQGWLSGRTRIEGVCHCMPTHPAAAPATGSVISSPCDDAGKPAVPARVAAALRRLGLARIQGQGRLRPRRDQRLVGRVHGRGTLRPAGQALLNPPAPRTPAGSVSTGHATRPVETGSPGSRRVRCARSCWTEVTMG